MSDKESPIMPNDAPVERLVERLRVILNRLEDIRDERFFPAHMLDAHDELVEICETAIAALSSPSVDAQHME